MATALSARTFAEEAIVVNTQALAAGVPATLLVRAFFGTQEFLGPSSLVSVYLDRRLAGTAPYSQTSIVAGTWLVGVVAPGFVPQEVQVGVQDSIAYEVIFHLVRSTGRLSASVEPADAELSVDGSPVAPGLLSLATGYHELSARRFGYESGSAMVLVPAQGIATADLVLKPASFAVTNFKASRLLFNPANSGDFGRTVFSFSVSGPGSGKLSLLDENGSVVFERDFGSFSTWDQTTAWDGRDRTGTPLPDGNYEASLTTASPSGESATLILDFAIDSSIVARPFGTEDGLVGLVYLPVPATSPTGLGSFDISLASSVDSFAPVISASAAISGGSFNLGFRASEGFSGPGDFEVGLEVPLGGFAGLGPGFGAAFDAGAGSDGSFTARASLVLPLFSDLGDELPSGSPSLFVGIAPGSSLDATTPGWETAVRLEISGGIALTDDSWLVGFSARGSSSDLVTTSPAFGGLTAAFEARLRLPSNPLVFEAEAGESLGADLLPASPWAQLGVGVWL